MKSKGRILKTSNICMVPKRIRKKRKRDRSEYRVHKSIDHRKRVVGGKPAKWSIREKGEKPPNFSPDMQSTTWMALENIMQSKVSQTEKVEHRMISLTCGA